MTMPPQADPAARAWQILEAIPDPEIPVLSIVDLGIVRELHWDGRQLQVAITPTYSGCPAAELIHKQVEHALAAAGFDGALVSEVLSPAWTTDWISEEGREKLRQYGIAPPELGSGRRALFGSELAVHCPRCASQRTNCVSEFGSTPCKAQYRCLDCLEPFDYFKCL
ncbi:MAG: phenylacetate-CoA oxygenase subunit PaaJ [Gammaproteobacteria bacterium]|jgi:ring-1,2-phenylacetyl-CoA epoxidase subunit PaaD|nr:phenylacetate-CoA oxygenase subunit PaaJ [Gammaproteobacteria bacterium]